MRQAVAAPMLVQTLSMDGTRLDEGDRGSVLKYECTVCTEQRERVDEWYMVRRAKNVEGGSCDVAPGRGMSSGTSNDGEVGSRCAGDSCFSVDRGCKSLMLAEKC
jgi:hypothetical protein